MMMFSPLRIFLLVTASLAGLLLAFAPHELKWINNTSFHTQPGFWSVVSLAGMVVFGLLAALTDSGSGNGHQRESVRTWQQNLLPVEYAIYFMIYVSIVPWIGYLFATIIVFPLLTLRAGYRQIRLMIISILSGIAIVLLFKTLLQVKIPGGVLYNEFPEGIRNFMILNF